MNDAKRQPQPGRDADRNDDIVGDAAIKMDDPGGAKGKGYTADPPGDPDSALKPADAPIKLAE